MPVGEHCVVKLHFNVIWNQNRKYISKLLNGSEMLHFGANLNKLCLFSWSQPHNISPERSHWSQLSRFTTVGGGEHGETIPITAQYITLQTSVQRRKKTQTGKWFYSIRPLQTLSPGAGAGGSRSLSFCPTEINDESFYEVNSLLNFVIISQTESCISLGEKYFRFFIPPLLVSCFKTLAGEEKWESFEFALNLFKWLSPLTPGDRCRDWGEINGNPIHRKYSVHL